MAGRYVSDCLLDGNDTSSRQVVSVFRCGKSVEAAVSFRVISVQQSGRVIRAVEYDPSMPEWRVHQPQSVSPLGNDRAMPRWDCGAMYAAGHIFWRYRAASLFMLDTTTMNFKTLDLPGELTFHHPLRYAIGEIEDGKGCLVCLQVPSSCLEARLQVWLLKKKEAGICWKFKKEVSVSKLLGADASVWNVPTVINGLALISKQERDDQYVVDLQSMTRLADVKFRGKGYLYQMPWPPAGLAATSAGSTPLHKDNCIDNLLSTSVGSRSSHDGVDLVDEESTDGDEHSKPSSSNSMKDPPTLSILDTNLDDGRANIQPMETDPGHDELTLQMAGAFPSANGDGFFLEDKSETNNLPMSTTEDAGMLEQQNSHKAHLEVSCADKVNEELYVNSTLRKNTEKVLLESHCCNLAIHNKSSEARKNLSAFSGTKKFAKRHDEQSTSKRQMAANSEDHLNGCNTYNGHVTHQSEAHDPNDEEPYGQRKKQKPNATSAVISLNNFKTTLGHLDHHIPSPSSCNLLVVESETISTTSVPQNNSRVPCRNSSMGQLPTTHDKPPNKGSSNCPQQGDPPKKSRRKEAAHPKGARRTHSSHAVHDISSVAAVTTSTPAVRQTNLRTFMCRLKGCAKVFPVKNAMEVHVKSSVHFEVSTGMFKCPSKRCRARYPRIENQNRHFMEIHGKGKYIPCTESDRKFTRRKSLNSHVERVHNSRETPLMCRFEGCTEEFSDNQARKTHEKSSKHVELDGMIKCDIKRCGVTFSMRENYNKHYRKFH